MVKPSVNKQLMRTESIGFQIDVPTKALIGMAAQLERRTCTEFCLSALKQAARQTVYRHAIPLTDADRGKIAALQAREEPPSSAVRQHVERYRRMCGQPHDALVVRTLSPHHSRDAFASARGEANRFLQAQSPHDPRQKIKGVYVLSMEANPTVILGYYTLGAIGLRDLHRSEGKLVDRPETLLVAAHVDHLAIAQSEVGKGLETFLLIDALHRASVSARLFEASLVFVDPRDVEGADLLGDFGFVMLGDFAKWAIPMAVVLQALAG